MIQTPRLLLRPLGPDDAGTVAAAALESLPELLPWMGWAHPDYGLDDAEGWIAFAREMWSIGREFAFGVYASPPAGAALGPSLGLRTTGAAVGGPPRFLGSCGLDRVDWTVRCANLGYWIRTADVGQGYATEAAGAVARWAFQTHGLHRVEIVAQVGNDRSAQTARRLGATDEGVARNRLVVHGKPQPARVFSLIPDDLAPRP